MAARNLSKFKAYELFRGGNGQNKIFTGAMLVYHCIWGQEIRFENHSFREELRGAWAIFLASMSTSFFSSLWATVSSPP